ncbi:hypothetical protein COU91_01685 [Candidatus Saccharibacteria bacterium CG10_big_fil_rev_8_21_14_0_10_47_8]|nr:MAG: hypothetical protein COU91_01685 [Candidatus Saccharibacteria bacterium CG10_big_fil_rev_8_21_14_0_10_47_8]
MAKFIHYPDRPKKLTAAFAKKEYYKLLAQLTDAEKSAKSDAWIALFADWNALSSYIGSEAGRISYVYSKDMSDKKLEAAERYIREKISPVTDKPEHELTLALLASKHREAVGERYGPILLEKYKLWLKPMDPVNTTLGIKTGNLSAKYEKIIANATVEVSGEKMNLSKVRSLGFSPDGDLRKAAYLASGKWFLDHHKQLADIYSQMVLLRDQMGRNLKFKNYVPLAYLNQSRMGYGIENVREFHRLVLKHLVPVLTRVFDARAKNLGQPTLRPWDVMFDPASYLPMGCAPVERQLDSAGRVFKKLSPVLTEHFENMRRQQLIDLENRPNKQAGAYCTDFSDEQKVLVFCNSTGDAEDVRILTHEMGHAFQLWESQHIEAIDLRHGSSELAEIYSMGMEFLSLPYMDEFFSAANAERFAKNKWVDSLYTICYVCVVDEFQHWVYENPKASAKARDDMWAKLYAKYLPGVDFSGLEQYAKIRWYAQRHIFVVPFYYIDYALAEIVAMQFALLAEKDHPKTMRTYLELCKIGGTKSFLQAIDDANLRSPFEEKLMTELAARTKKALL